MIKFIIELLTKLKTILNSLELIKYIISKNVDNYPQEIISATELGISQLKNTNNEIENFIKCKKNKLLFFLRQANFFLINYILTTL